jgi:hypothetical protein
MAFRYASIAEMEEEKMTESTYEAPQLTVLGNITDMTQGKPGQYFDFPHSSSNIETFPPPGVTPGGEGS